ncbi:unnamed protein product [Prunus brigantina]
MASNYFSSTSFLYHLYGFQLFLINFVPIIFMASNYFSSTSLYHLYGFQLFPIISHQLRSYHHTLIIGWMEVSPIIFMASNYFSSTSSYINNRVDGSQSSSLCSNYFSSILSERLYWGDLNLGM